MFNSNSTLAARSIGYQKFASLPEPKTEFETFAQYQIKKAQDHKIATAYTRMFWRVYGTTDMINPATGKFE